MRYLLLFILLIPIIVLAQDEDNPVLIPGEAMTLSVTADTRENANFTIDEISYIRIQAQSESEAFDPVIWIVDSNNRLIAYNDNADEQSNAAINNLYLLPDSYTVYIDSFNGVSEGGVTLSLNRTDPFDTAIEPSESGVFINATLPEDAIFEYEFSASAGDVMTLTARDISSTLDTYLAIYDESGELLIANDDHQSADLTLNIFDAKLSGWVIPADGNYIVRIHDFSGKAGQFELNILISR